MVNDRIVSVLTGRYRDGDGRTSPQSIEMLRFRLHGREQASHSISPFEKRTLRFQPEPILIADTRQDHRTTADSYVPGTITREAERS